MPSSALLLLPVFCDADFNTASIAGFTCRKWSSNISTRWMQRKRLVDSFRGLITTWKDHSSSKGRLERLPGSGYQISEIVVEPKVVLASAGDLSSMPRIGKAKENCFISQLHKVDDQDRTPNLSSDEPARHGAKLSVEKRSGSRRLGCPGRTPFARSGDKVTTGAVLVNLDRWCSSK